MAKTRLISVWVEPELYNRLKAIARRRDRSLAYIAREALWDYVEREEQKRAQRSIFG